MKFGTTNSVCNSVVGAGTQVRGQKYYKPPPPSSVLEGGVELQSTMGQIDVCMYTIHCRGS